MSFKKEVRKAIKRVPPLDHWLQERAQRAYIRRRIQRYPQLHWRSTTPCPQHRVEAARMQVGSQLFVFGGYITIGTVCQRVDLFDLSTHRWEMVSTLPSNASQTHNGTAYDGQQHIYLIGGQLGPNCSPVSADCFAFDTKTYQWSELPPLPQGRYMPLVHFSNGRIHCLSGSMPDRCSSAQEHWSIGVHRGQATEPAWREEVPLPSPRTHTASHVIDNTLYVFGGQSGDVQAIQGSPEYLCDFDSSFDELTDESYTFDLHSGKLQHIQPMPAKLSHSEHAVLQVGSKIILAGGVLNRQQMSDLIFSYDLEHNTWSELGRLPYPMKSKIAAYHDGQLYIVTGQRSVSETDLKPDQVLDTVWHAKLPQSLRSS